MAQSMRERASDATGPVRWTGRLINARRRTTRRRSRPTPKGPVTMQHDSAPLMKLLLEPLEKEDERCYLGTEVSHGQKRGRRLYRWSATNVKSLGDRWAAMERQLKGEESAVTKLKEQLSTRSPSRTRRASCRRSGAGSTRLQKTAMRRARRIWAATPRTTKTATDIEHHRYRGPILGQHRWSRNSRKPKQRPEAWKVAPLDKHPNPRK